MNTYAISIKPAESAGTCEKCGNFCEIMFEVTISLGAKSQMLFLCERCSKIAKSSVDKKNSGIISKEIPKTMVTNQYTKSSQKVDDYECSSESNSKKEFNIDDTSTYYLLNTAQKKIVNDYQSVIHTSLWKEGFNAVDLIRQSNVSPDDLRTKILTRFCDVAGYYWIEGPINFSIPLDMFGYIKGKNVNEDESIYYSQRPVFTKYDNRDFGEILDTVGEALINWKSKNLLTCTMAATIFYLRSTDESVLDILMHMLVDGAKLHHDQQNQELYDCSWTLWALVAAAVDFDNRYKKLITKHINEATDETSTVISNDAASQEYKTINVNARDVQKLRELTGIGMMDCKNALIEADGDMNKAESILKNKGSHQYKKSNSDDVQSYSKTGSDNNAHPVSQNRQINNGSSSNQNRNSNNNTVGNRTLRQNYEFSIQLVGDENERLTDFIYVYLILIFGDIIDKYKGLNEIECVFAILGIIGLDGEAEEYSRYKYSRYSHKYNNDLRLSMDSLASMSLNLLKNGYKDDPYINLCVAISAIFCNYPSNSVVYEKLQTIESLEKKGKTINPSCGELWGFLALWVDYYCFSNFSENEVKVFYSMYNPLNSSKSVQKDNGNLDKKTINMNPAIDNSTVFALKERLNYYRKVLEDLPVASEAIFPLLSTYTNKVFSDFAKSHQGVSGIEKVYAFLGVRGNGDEKSKYSLYSQKYNNNLEKIADDVVKLMLKGYEDGNNNDPELFCVCFSAIALCSNPSPSVISIMLKEVERIAEKGCYISPNCMDLWAIMSVFIGYGDGKAPFDPADAERFRHEYLPSLQNDSSDTNNLNTPELNTTESYSNFYSKKDTNSRNEKNVLFFGQIGHGKTTLLTAIREVLTSEGINLETYDNYGFSFVNNSNKYMFTECPDNAQNIIPFINNRGVQCDCAVMVISTISGPMQETKEQLNLIRQLGVKELVVYMSMTDKADDPELIELVEMEIRETIAEYGFDADDTVILNGSPLSVLHEILNLNF